MKIRNHTRRLRWQRGQALAEYWVTIPAGIILMLAAAGIVQFITNGLTQTVEGLEYTGDIECAMQGTDDEKAGPLFTDLNGHTVEVVMDIYDEETDTTQIAYQVTSGGDHDISHWILGLPPGVARHIVWTSEPWIDHTTKADPTTGMFGIKFDIGYGSGGEDEAAEPADKPGKKKSAAPLALTGYSFREETDSRTIIIHLAGYFEWDITDLGIKAGTEVFMGTITAPARQVESPAKSGC
ncbi:MAG: hypothetical protein Kow00106_14660 [Anaerolineae bacterium]